MGRSGRDAVEKHLPGLKDRYDIDVTIVNAENTAHGRGPTIKVCKDFLAMGIDCITGGDHIWDQREIIPYIHDEPRLLRPLNFPEGTPGQGTLLHELDDGRKILIAHALGCQGMKPLDDPFARSLEIVERHPMGRNVQAIFIDFHAEYTGEKMAFAKFLEGKVSAVIGSHTHVPTADAHIMAGGTAYQSDSGMCGDYDSVIGMKKEEPIRRLTRKMSMEHFTPADGEATLCGVIVETDDKTGKARKIISIRQGGLLDARLPDL